VRSLPSSSRKDLQSPKPTTPGIATHLNINIMEPTLNEFSFNSVPYSKKGFGIAEHSQETWPNVSISIYTTKPLLQRNQNSSPWRAPCLFFTASATRASFITSDIAAPMLLMVRTPVNTATEDDAPGCITIAPQAATCKAPVNYPGQIHVNHGDHLRPQQRMMSTRKLTSNLKANSNHCLIDACSLNNLEQ
jgi:hypothetical protein